MGVSFLIGTFPLLASCGECIYEWMERKAYLAALLTIFIWGSAFTGISIALESIPSAHMALLRFLVASLVFLFISFRFSIPVPDRADLPRMFALSFCGITTYHLCLAYGQVNVSPGPTALLVATVPIWTAVISRFVEAERLSRSSWYAIGISFIGVSILIFSRAQSWAFAWGALLILIAAIATAIMFVLQRPIVAKYGSIAWTAYSIWMGTIPMLFLANGLGETLDNATARSLLAVCCIGTFPILGYITWSYALSKLPATAITSFLNLSPIFATFTAWWILGVIPGSLGILGGIVTIIGVLSLNFSMRASR